MLLHVLLPAGLLPNRRLHAAGFHGQMLLSMAKNPGAVAQDVWHSLGEALHAFIRSRVPSQSDADDILQDVFTRVIEKSSSLRQADRIESWVYQTARNAVADFYRRRRPLPELPAEAVDCPHVVEANQNLAVGESLARLMAELPSTLRDAVRLYEVEGIPQADIAEQLGISISAVKSRVQRGRRELEALLKRCCELELDRRGNILRCEPAKSSNCGGAACGCRD